MSIRNVARQTIEIELEEAGRLLDRIDDEFERVVKAILDCTGRVIVTGMGKSGHIGKKIAASLASTGTPAFFMHPAEAFHGDLGMVKAEDMVIVISNSGESGEIVNILPILKKLGAGVIAMCGCRGSTLGENCDYFLNIGVSREAGPLGLAPTCSTTSTLIMGDALTLALVSERGFSKKDFATYHPGGALGRRLLLTIRKLMHSGDDNPVIIRGSKVREAIFIMTAKGLGAVSVIDEAGTFLGLVTDGMIRRRLEQDDDFLGAEVEDIMVAGALTVTAYDSVDNAMKIMESHKPRPVTVLPVLDGERKAVGMIHFTDLLHKGII